MRETKEKLIKMKGKWEELGIVPYFAKAHHFASEKFISEPPTLYKHYNYCIGRDIQAQNIQTLDRCLKVAELYDGFDINKAIKKSLEEYPVL